MKFTKVINTLALCVVAGFASAVAYNAYKAYATLRGEASAKQDNEDLRTYADVEGGYEEVEKEVVDSKEFPVIGDGPDEISGRSEEYREIISEAFVESLTNPEHTLTLIGKVHGLGARGETVQDETGRKGYIYDAAAIGRLRSRLIAAEEEAAQLEEVETAESAPTPFEVDVDVDEVLDTEDVDNDNK